MAQAPGTSGSTGGCCPPTARTSRSSTGASSWATASSRRSAPAAAGPTELPEHLARLRRSADGLAIALPADLDALIATGIADLLDAEGLGGPDGDASIRITVSRGPVRTRGLLPPDEAVHATIAIQAWPVVPPPADHLARGLHLVASAVRRDPENPLAALKTTSRADYVYARVEARRAGADDALFLTIDGHLSEATTANVFLVRRRRTASRSSRRRRSTARSCPAPRGRGCSPGAAASACASTRAASPRPTWRPPTRRSSRRASPGSCR